MMNQSPQTIGYALADLPVGMAAYYNDKFAEWTDTGGEPEKILTYDEMLDAILADQHRDIVVAAVLGRPAGRRRPFQRRRHPDRPGLTVFRAEIYRAPRSWGERAFGNLIYWNEVDEGGHLAAWEQPELCAEEVRAAFRSFR